MNKQFAAANTETCGTKAEAKNKSTLISAVLSSQITFLYKAEVLAFQAETLPCWLQYTFLLYLLLGYGSDM